jgi:hypothetical protein
MMGINGVRNDITCKRVLGLTGGDRRSFDSGAGPFSAPFGFVGVVPFHVLPQEEGAAGEHQDKNLLPGFSLSGFEQGGEFGFLRHRCLLGAAFVRHAG